MRFLRPTYGTPVVISVLAMAYAAGVILLAVAGLWAAHRATLAMARNQAVAISTFSAAYTARMYDLADWATRDIVEAESQDSSGVAARRSLVQAADATSLNDYYVLFASDGSLRASSDPLRPGQIQPQILDVHRQGAERHVGQVFRSPLSGQIIYPYSRALTGRDGAFAGVAGASVRPQGVRPTSERAAADPQVSVWTTDGRFVAATFVDFDADGHAIPPEPPARLGAMLPGRTRDQDGAMRAEARVEGWPLVVVTEFDRHGLLSAWRRTAAITLTMVVLLLAAGLGLSAFGLRLALREERLRNSLALEKAGAEEMARARGMLMQEAHHRVKNSLMLASSFVQLQARHATPEVAAALAPLNARIASIALAHQALYADGASGEVDLAEYLTTLVHELFNGLGLDDARIRMKLELTSVRVAADKATPVGLIVSEAVTNAAKYAFGPGTVGEIKVRCEPTGDEVLLCIADNGGGSVGGETQGTGLGSRLMRSLAAQLGGRLSAIDREGTEVRVVFPLR